MSKDNLVVELTVRNHAGVMSHITGMFSRRVFNLEGILCGKIEDGHKSRMYLLVNNDDRIDQIIRQLEKLYDVLEVSLHDDYDCSVFGRLDEMVKYK